MKVFILEWNPEISSYRMEDFNAELANFEGEWFNWSVWDWKEAQEGDMFYLIKCGGEGPNGIVMQGHFVSDPYAGEDWSGKGRLTYYMDMEPEYMIHPLRCEILTTEDLNEAMPEFQWKGGHSGRVLPFDYSLKLEEMWTADSSGLNVPPVSLSNVPGTAESIVPLIAETNVPGISL